MACSKSSSVGTSSIPCKALAYTWNVKDAKIFLKQLETIESPLFSLSLPAFKSTWYLLLEKDDDNNVCISLCHGSQDEEFDFNDHEKETTILVSDCKFIYNSSNATKPCSKRCHIYQHTPTDCVTRVLMKYTDIGQHLSNGTLTVQVTANILCIDDHIETVQEERPLPQYNGIKSLLDDQLFTDLTIKCAEKEFKAHKAVLASQSPVFKRMLMTNMTEKESNVIELTDIDPPALSELLTYLYSGTTPNMKSLAKNLLVVADKYELSHLLAMCENNLLSDLVVTNVVELLVLADMHNAAHLKKACLKYVCANSAEVHETSQWKEFQENCEGHASLLMEIITFTV